MNLPILKFTKYEVLLMRIDKMNNKGLSLVELIIVVAIIAILSAAISPALIRYIEKSRKKVDVQSAEMIYDAVIYSLGTSDEEVYESFMNTENDYKSASFIDPESGHEMRPVAYARGVKVGDWENSLFKCAHNDGKGGEQAFVNGMLDALVHDKAHGKGYTWSKDKKNPNAYDGKSTCMVPLKFGKKMKSDIKNDGGYPEVYPEAYIIARDTVTNDPVIYIGAKPSGKLLQAYWRIYPEPCDKYK